ncbi:hypothetical protein, partial [Vibrio parahaemolyticus]
INLKNVLETICTVLVVALLLYLFDLREKGYTVTSKPMSHELQKLADAINDLGQERIYEYLTLEGASLEKYALTYHLSIVPDKFKGYVWWENEKRTLYGKFNWALCTQEILVNSMSKGATFTYEVSLPNKNI